MLTVPVPVPLPTERVPRFGCAPDWTLRPPLLDPPTSSGPVIEPLDELRKVSVAALPLRPRLWVVLSLTFERRSGPVDDNRAAAAASGLGEHQIQRVHDTSVVDVERGAAADHQIVVNGQVERIDAGAERQRAARNVGIATAATCEPIREWSARAAGERRVAGREEQVLVQHRIGQRIRTVVERHGVRAGRAEGGLVRRAGAPEGFQLPGPVKLPLAADVHVLFMACAAEAAESATMIPSASRVNATATKRAQNVR